MRRRPTPPPAAWRRRAPARPRPAPRVPGRPSNSPSPRHSRSRAGRRANTGSRRARRCGTSCPRAPGATSGTAAPSRARASTAPSSTRSASESCCSAVRRTEVSNNRIYGNYLIGVGALKQILLKQTDAADLIGNQVHDNQFGLGGADLNRRELFYDGTGTDNCFGSNVGVQTTTRPTAPRSTRARSRGPTRSTKSAQSEAINWSVGDPRTRRSGSGTPTPPRAASRRWSITRREDSDRDRADRRR
jgi:hypothetical protein